MNPIAKVLFALLSAFVLVGMTTLVRADFSPLWLSRVPLGDGLSSNPAGMWVDPDGVSYVTGISDGSPGSDITTVSFAPDGTTRWSQIWSSGGSFSADQARGITMGPGGVLYVVGDTPGPDASRTSSSSPTTRRAAPCSTRSNTVARRVAPRLAPGSSQTPPGIST